MLKTRVDRLERETGHGGRKLVILEGNKLTNWEALEDRYFEEYDRSPANNDLFIRVIRFGSNTPDPGLILNVIPITT